VAEPITDDTGEAEGLKAEASDEYEADGARVGCMRVGRREWCGDGCTFVTTRLTCASVYGERLFFISASFGGLVSVAASLTGRMAADESEKPRW